MKTWFITGASRGLGRAIAKAALARGDKAAITSRNIKSLDFLAEEYKEAILPLQLDVTDAKDVKSAFSKALTAFGNIDIIVNNAGYILLGALEEVTEKEARDVMETMFWGPFYLTREALPHMRQRRSGAIVQVSSLAGIGGLPGNTMYAAAKYALEGMSETLKREVESFGIKVLILEPAGIRTDIASGIVMSKPMKEYDHVVGEQRQRFASGKDEHAMGDADKCAEVLLQLLDMETPPTRLLMSASGAEIGQLIHQSRLDEVKKWEQLSRSITISH